LFAAYSPNPEKDPNKQQNFSLFLRTKPEEEINTQPLQAT
jgi:hypothetical protein